MITYSNAAFLKIYDGISSNETTIKFAEVAVKIFSETFPS